MARVTSAGVMPTSPTRAQGLGVQGSAFQMHILSTRRSPVRHCPCPSLSPVANKALQRTLVYVAKNRRGGRCIVRSKVHAVVVTRR